MSIHGCGTERDVLALNLKGYGLWYKGRRPSDKVRLPADTAALYFPLGAASVRLATLGDARRRYTFTDIAPGTRMDIRAVRVYSTGTSAKAYVLIRPWPPVPHKRKGARHRGA